jgi:hypothetical protein
MTDFFEFQGSVDVVYDGLFPNGQLPGIGKMSLDALSGLRKTNEEFLPTDLFVRSEMLLVWNLLDTNEGNSAVQSQILLGSAGVGKSVLCFLQAVRMAYRGKRVLYFRKTKAESDTSLWCMERSGNDVRIRFDRSVEKGVEIWKLKIPAMLYCFSDLFPAGTKKDVFSKAVKSKEVLVFVDGPNHAAAADTLFGNAHYFCTSGGHPLLKSEEVLTKRIVVMNGWQCQDFKRALDTVKTSEGMNALRSAMTRDGLDDDDMDEEFYDDDVYECLYYHYGGRIREAAQCVSGRISMQVHIEYVIALVNSVPTVSASLFLDSTECSADPNSKGTLRTMFRGERGIGATQIVDSQFILGLLRNKISAQEYLNAYKKAMILNRKAVAGHLFEELMHSIYCSTQHNSPAVQGSHQATGTGHEGVKQLLDKCVYWIPSTVNFAVIDAAFIDTSGNIWCVQYTVSSQHSFSGSTLRSKFLKRIPQSAGAVTSDDSCTILFVVPKGVEFANPDTDPFPNRIIYVDCTNMETVLRGVPEIFIEAMSAQP